MGIATFLQEHFPPPLTVAMMRAKRAVAPSPAFRAFQRIHAQIESPQTVVAGPFEGMRYFDPAGYLAKLLGTYENELHEAVRRLAHDLRPDVVVNVGSAEGFYTVGLARLLPNARVLAYDISPLARYRTAKLAALNNVAGRVETRGFCTAAELERICATAQRPAVLSDCEGFEWELLDPAAAPSLCRAIILVELHEMIRPGVTREIERRFAESHAIETIACRDRGSADLPPGVTMSPEDAALVMDEARAQQQSFLFLVPRSA